MSGANLPPLKTRKLGRTNVSVTELGLGTAPLGELFDKVEDDEAAAIIGAAWDGGVRYFDTSPWYGRGLAEHSLGRALYRKPRDEFVISTKIGRVLRRPLGPNAIKDQWLGGLEFQTVFDYSYDGVMRSFEDSLQRLGINRVDVLLIYDLDPWDHNPATLNAYFTAAQDERMEGACGIARGGRHRRDRRGLQLDGLDPALSRSLRHGFLPAGDALHAARAGRARERVPALRGAGRRDHHRRRLQFRNSCDRRRSRRDVQLRARRPRDPGSG